MNREHLLVQGMDRVWHLYLREGKVYWKYWGQDQANQVPTPHDNILLFSAAADRQNKLHLACVTRHGELLLMTRSQNRWVANIIDYDVISVVMFHPVAEEIALIYICHRGSRLICLRRKLLHQRWTSSEALLSKAGSKSEVSLAVGGSEWGTVLAVGIESVVLLVEPGGADSYTVNLGEKGVLASACCSKDGLVYVSLFDGTKTNCLISQQDRLELLSVPEDLPAPALFQEWGQEVFLTIDRTGWPEAFSVTEGRLGEIYPLGFDCLQEPVILTLAPYHLSGSIFSWGYLLPAPKVLLPLTKVDKKNGRTDGLKEIYDCLVRIEEKERQNSSDIDKKVMRLQRRVVQTEKALEELKTALKQMEKANSPQQKQEKGIFHRWLRK